MSNYCEKCGAKLETAEERNKGLCNDCMNESSVLVHDAVEGHQLF